MTTVRSKMRNSFSARLFRFLAKKTPDCHGEKILQISTEQQIPVYVVHSFSVPKVKTNVVGTLPPLFSSKPLRQQSFEEKRQQKQGANHVGLDPRLLR
jgi:hypothetical protein